MISRMKIQIILISILFFFLILLVIILPIVLIRKQNRGASKSNTTIIDASLITSTSPSFITTEITPVETTITADPLKTVFYASKNALSSWTVNGSVFVDNGARHPSIDGSWYICGEYGSSISRSFVLNDEQIAIYYPTSQLHVETHFIGDIEMTKSPPCSQSSTTLLINKTDSMTNNILEKLYIGRFRICRDDVDMTLTIAFLNATSCVKHVFISIWNPFRPFSG